LGKKWSSRYRRLLEYQTDITEAGRRTGRETDSLVSDNEARGRDGKAER
jgi:hypothetical protein